MAGDGALRHREGSLTHSATPDRESEHPLFRVLVLMGGSLALSCGGSAVIDGNAGGSGGTRTVGGAGQGGVAQGGSGAQGGAGAIAGTVAIGGGASSGEVDAGPLDCPPAQWDCSGRGATCQTDPWNAGPPAGCVCDLKRPKSVADCAANEDLFCLRSFSGEPDPATWDTSTHIQCACVPGPAVPDYETCGMACTKIYTELAGQGNATCSLPPTMTCDPSGNCTATAANVLRQDGIVCGCAPIVLK